MKSEGISLQDFAYCGPEQENCLANQTLKNKECLVSCEGLYADIADVSLRQDMMKGIGYLSFRFRLQQLITELRIPHNNTRVGPWQ